MDQFLEYCKNGELDNIKKLSQKKRNLDSGFRWACENGHYDIVKYLVNLYKRDTTYKPIDIHTRDEWSFRWACTNGHYDIVQYLVEFHRKHSVYKPIKNYLIIFKKFDKYLL